MSLAEFIEVAENEVGEKETGTTNQTKYGKWFGSDGQPWCGMFIAWCANEAGILTTASSANLPYVPKLAGVGAIRDWYANCGRCLAPNMNAASANRLRPGDVVIIDNATSGDTNHAGIVVSVDYNTKKAVVVEGNYSDKVSKVTYTDLVSNNESNVRISYLCSNNVRIS
ncbi:MAG: CHAP domain-containing protein [Peptococcaceae bacterium]|nr:CHAP domain-containing protein [Peptococcaceae bacterium]